MRRSPRTTSRPLSSVASPWVPIHTTSPPGRTASTAVRRVAAVPAASMTTSAPRPRVNARISDTTASRTGLRSGSAPTACAIARRASLVSTATSRSAPPARATWSARSPMAPQPITTTVSGNFCSSRDHTWTPLASGSTSAPCRGDTRSGSGHRLDLGAADADGGHLEHGLPGGGDRVVHGGHLEDVPGRVAERFHAPTLPCREWVRSERAQSTARVETQRALAQDCQVATLVYLGRVGLGDLDLAEQERVLDADDARPLGRRE